MSIKGLRIGILIGNSDCAKAEQQNLAGTLTSLGWGWVSFEWLPLNATAQNRSHDLKHNPLPLSHQNEFRGLRRGAAQVCPRIARWFWKNALKECEKMAFRRTQATQKFSQTEGFLGLWAFPPKRMIFTPKTPKCHFCTITSQRSGFGF